MKTLVNGLAELVAGIRFNSLPEEVVNETKRRVLDALGCALGGYRAEPCAMVRSLVADLGGRPESTVFGEPNRTSCEKATLANATMLRYLDYMDSHAGSDGCHPCFNIPPCLAVAERTGASGQDLIAAIVAGYEVHIRFQEFSGDPNIKSRGWFNGINLEFSVPLAAGKLLGLSIDELTNAVAISASHANTLDAISCGTIPSSKSIADGMIASTGVMGALLAQKGIVGPKGILEGPNGFAKVVAGRIDEERFLERTGQYKIMEVNTKWFNTVRTAQTAVAGLFQLLQEHQLSWYNVKAITIFLPCEERDAHDGIWNDVSRLRPQNRDSANHSLIFSVAVALVDRELGPDQYDDTKLRDPQVLSLVDRVTIESDPSLDQYWPAAAVTRVALKTKSGQEHDAITLYPPGHHKNRLSDEQMQEKFRKLARHVLDEEETEAVIQKADHLEDLKSLDELMIHLAQHHERLPSFE